MIRAIRHASRLNFAITPETWAAICENADLLSSVPRARLNEELLKEFKGGYIAQSFPMLQEAGILKYILPYLSQRMQKGGEESNALLLKTLEKIDELVQKGVNVKPPVIFLALSIDLFHEEKIAKVGGLKKLVNLIFKPAGVSNNDRLLIEKIFKLAMSCFEKFDKDKKSLTRYTQFPIFEDATQLLYFTANNQVGEACFNAMRKLM